LKELGSSIDPNMVKPFYWFLHKQFRKIFDQIIINDQELKSLKLLVEKKKQSVILVPSFKSYADFVLLTYIHLIYGIDLPFVTGLKEFEEITFITTLLRKAGGYFIDKS